MRPRRLLALGTAILAAAGCISIAAGLPLATAEVVQHGHFRVSLAAKLSPDRLPRRGSAPVQFSLGAHFIAAKGSTPPQLKTMRIQINRHGQIDPAAVPGCRMENIQPATSTNALAACRSALVGEGQFAANVRFTQQAPFPSNGKLLAFNGRWHGRPAILAHIYGPKPVPTSITIPFVITTSGGEFGTVLSASLPRFSSKWGYVRAISMKLGGSGGGRSPRARGYLSAACPAPNGLHIVGFPLTRASFTFSGGAHLKQTLSRSCRPRGR